MLIFNHRINTLSKLKSTPFNVGVEIDLRSSGNDIILQHDPFVGGVLFTEWLEFYQHAGLILNVKEDGLEERVISTLKSYNINNYLFLDQSFPSLVKYFTLGVKKSAVRYSEFESIETIKLLQGKVDWVWVDCFNKYPLTKENEVLLHQMGFRICIVSPELQGRSQDSDVQDAADFFYQNKILVDAVCTKRFEIWNGLCSIS